MRDRCGRRDRSVKWLSSRQDSAAGRPACTRGPSRPTTPPSGANEEPASRRGFSVACTTLTALHAPGHSPGSTCLHSPDLSTIFTGDTRFRGGPGATGRSYSDKPTILDSIRSRLLTLHGDTVVKTGHGEDTTVSAEISHVH